MKIEVGKVYRDKYGNIVSIVSYEEDSPLPFIGSDACGYTEDGKFNPSYAPEDSMFDLVEEC